jgi:energy-coupling factor transport system ATP-binding protein
VQNTAKTVLRVKALSSTPNDSLALKNINFSLAESECIALVGANGAGKTTLVRYLIGLRSPDSGQIHIMGRPAGRMKTTDLARYVGLAFQNPHNQFFKQTVREEIDVGPRVLDCYDAHWIDSLMTLFRLTPLLDRPPYRLSTGQKKRVAFAAALAVNPPVLILDEPTAGQDGHFRRALGQCLDDLRSRGQSVLMITHDLTFAEQYAHRWLLMAKGEIIARGTPTEIMGNQPAMDRAGLTPTDTFKLFHDAQ